MAKTKKTASTAEPKVKKAVLKAAPVPKKLTTKKGSEVVAATVPAKVQPAVKKEAKSGLKTELYAPTGEKKGTVSLPEIWFGAKINTQLMAQAVRVYLANQREGAASTKTRGEVEGSTRKIYKQKGTGRARHGAIRAPIFVGGGVTFGPKPRSYQLDMPKKMKRQALASAFTSQLTNQTVKVVADVATMPKKTKAFSNTLVSLSCDGTTLFLLGKEEIDMIRALRNIEAVEVMPVKDANTYAVLKNKYVVLTEKAVEELSSLTH